MLLVPFTRFFLSSGHWQSARTLSCHCRLPQPLMPLAEVLPPTRPRRPSHRKCSGFFPLGFVFQLSLSLFWAHRGALSNFWLALGMT